MTPVDRYQSCCTVPGWVITSAVRYARARATYIVGMTVDLLISEWEHIHPHDQAVILSDLQEEMYWRQETTDRSSLSRVDDPDWERAWQYCRDHAPKEWTPDAMWPLKENQ